MIKKFADKMRGNSCETKLFYMGVIIIIMGFLFILGVFLGKKEQMKHIEGIDELAKEYINWRYMDEWNDTGWASMKFKQERVNGESAEFYILEFIQGENQYTIYYLPDECRIAWYNEEGIGKLPYLSACYKDMEIEFEDKSFNHLKSITIYYPNGHQETYDESEFEKLSQKTTIVEKAEKLIEIVSERLQYMSDEQQRTFRPLYKSIGIAVALIYIWFFLMPPNVKMQQDDILRKIRCCVLGTVALIVGVFWGILGGILAALLVYFINRGLLKYGKWFYTKTIVLATLTNEILCNVLLRYSNGVFEILIGPILKRGNGIGLKCKFGMVVAGVVLFAFYITNRKSIEENNLPSPY